MLLPSPAKGVRSKGDRTLAPLERGWFIWLNDGCRSVDGLKKGFV
jgi:hypothetical protein